MRRKKDKSIPRTANYVLISYCHWVHVDKRERIWIDHEKHNLNSENLTDCADILISYNADDEFIATAINAGDSTDFTDDAAVILIADINAGNLTDCADILISDDAAGGLIATAVDYVDSTDCAEDASGGFIAAIDAVSSMDCAYITVSNHLLD